MVSEEGFRSAPGADQFTYPTLLKTGRPEIPRGLPIDP